MNKKIYKIILIILIVLIPIFIFEIFNMMVSLKYETENMNDCISLITGDDLCKEINVFKILSAISFLLLCLMSIFKKKIVKI
ncbi:hypothetical protein SAMN05443292_1838 [Halpernia frigidisoli]|uniref:Uncharacterized protein n=1 Tax=Halpernia frigidisoli TaxID=1125876 RepID=A0A1I3GGW3_9FLAO|nr:hypothetical protein SAMN05443292_1838 [Halpernia frigidisoli]